MREILAGCTDLSACIASASRPAASSASMAERDHVVERFFEILKVVALPELQHHPEIAFGHSFESLANGEDGARRVVGVERS